MRLKNMNDAPQTTILIVDDNPANLGVLFESLQREGFKVLVAQDGESALTRVQHIQPDIILLDVIMPGIDGFETCRRLKAQPLLQDTPIIFMTALTDMVNEVKGLELGAVDYIAKPIHVERVLARVKTHLRLRHLQQNLQRQNAELDAFAHTVAHDLRSPLSIQMGYAEMLLYNRAQLDDEQLDGALRKVWDAGQRAVNIVDALLLLATVRRQSDIDRHPLDMARIVIKAQRRVSALVEQSQGKIIEPKTWPVASGYAPWIEEVWVNYFSNGLKYGGHPPRLELGAEAMADGMVRFLVKDNGEGVALDRQAVLFAEFTRLNEIRATGYGLGLSIVRRIIDRLGGQVGMENAPGSGSIFYFTLPAAEPRI